MVLLYNRSVQVRK